jgi:hypothetical protein
MPKQWWGPPGFTQEPTEKGKENKSKQQPRAALQDIKHGQLKTTVTLHVGGCRELICKLVLCVQCEGV